jgi:septal ring factor EnvC (AmiA/AmiB activator)
MKVTIAKLESEIKSKDDKIQELSKVLSELKEKNTTLTYQIKEIKNGGVQKQKIQIGKKSKQECNGNECTMDQIEDLE